MALPLGGVVSGHWFDRVMERLDLWVTGRATLFQFPRLFRRSARRVVDLPAYAGWGDSSKETVKTPPQIGPSTEWAQSRAMDQHRQHWPEDGASRGCGDHLGRADVAVQTQLAKMREAAQQRRETPQEEARTRNNSGAPTVFEAETMRARPSYEAARASALLKAEKASEAGERVAYVTEDEYLAAHVTVAMRYDPMRERGPVVGPTALVVHTPRGEVRLDVAKPAPAENARRYSEEGGTW